MTDPTPTRDEAVLPIGYMRPVDKDGNSFWCSRQRSAYYTDPVFASAPAPASGGVDAVALREICEDMLDMHHGRQASMDVDAPSFGRGAAAGWDAAVSAFYKRALASLSPAATPVSEADMRAFGASEMAAYKWPDDTPEHRAARAAFCEGAALAKPSSPAGGEPTGNSGLLLGEASADDAPCYLSSEHADSWAKGFNAAVRALSQSTSAGRVGG